MPPLVHRSKRRVIDETVCNELWSTPILSLTVTAKNHCPLVFQPTALQRLDECYVWYVRDRTKASHPLCAMQKRVMIVTRSI